MAGASESAGDWLCAARAGSQEALGQLLEDCRAYLLAIAKQELDPKLRAKAGASDLVQETFLEAHRDFARFQGNTASELLAWLRCLLKHNLANFKRKCLAAKRTDAHEISLTPHNSSVTLCPEPAAETPTPSSLAVRNEQLEALHRALERLPDDYRQVIRYRHEEDRSFDDIGKLMGRTANGAQKLWSRAVERLEHELETL